MADLIPQGTPLNVGRAAINDLNKRVNNIVGNAGSSNTEIVDSRFDAETGQIFEVLPDRLNDLSRNKASKDDFIQFQTIINTLVAAAASGSPKGTYATLAALQAAFPTGTTGTYVVAADGKLYSYVSGAWTAIVQYQSTGIAANSITYNLTKFLKPGKNLFNKNAVDSAMLLDHTTGTESSNSSYVTSEFIPVTAGTTYAIVRCRKVVLYNSQKSYVNGYDVPSNAPTTVTPTVDGYMRISITTTDLGVMQVEIGSTSTTYSKFGLTLDALNLFNTIGTSELTQGSVRPGNTSFLVRGKNLFSPANRTVGIFLSESNGSITSNATYDTSDYIPVTAGTTYAITNCRKVIIFGLDKTFVQGFDLARVATTVTPTVDGYMRVSFYAADIQTSQIEVGSSNTAYEAYNLTMNGFNVNSINDKSLPATKLIDGDIPFTKTNFFTAGKNLFNKATVTIGYYKDASNGNPVASANYDYSDFIPVTAGTTYAINTCRKVTVYDANKNAISAQGIDNSANGAVTVTPLQNGYIVISLLHANLGTAQVEVGSASTSYEVFGMKPVVPIIQATQTTTTDNILTGKKIINFGDSIFAGDGNSGVGPAELIATANGMTCYDKAVGGATVRVVSGSTNNILNQINNAAETDPDFVLLDGLTNDAYTTITGDPSQLGTISVGYTATLNTATFCGAFETILKTIITKWLGKKFLYVCVHKMPSRDTGSQDTLQSLAKQMCAKWGVPVVDLYNEGGLNTYIDIMRTTYADAGGTHPNGLGYSTFYVPRIAAKMKAL